MGSVLFSSFLWVLLIALQVVHFKLNILLFPLNVSMVDVTCSLFLFYGFECDVQANYVVTFLWFFEQVHLFTLTST